MNFKRPLSISPNRPNQPTKIGICQVCGDKANIINYGALSCSSCKTFFRRRGFHSKVLFTYCYYIFILQDYLFLRTLMYVLPMETVL